MSEIAKLFEAVSHPARIKILELLENSPRGFSELKRILDMKSSGNLDHHIKKIGELVCINHQGLYALTDNGREVLKAIRTIESTVKATSSSGPSTQSKWALAALVMVGGGFMIALFASISPMIMSKPFDAATLGAVMGLVGAVVGYLASMKGVKATITSEGKSLSVLTYWPSLGMRWESRDWALNMFLFVGWFVLLFDIIIAQVFLPWGGDYVLKILWYVSGLLSLTLLFTSAIAISRRILMKATKLIQRMSQQIVSADTDRQNRAIP